MAKTIFLITCVLIVASAMRVNLSHEGQGFREGRVTIQADNGKYLTRCGFTSHLRSQFTIRCLGCYTS